MRSAGRRRCGPPVAVISPKPFSPRQILAKIYTIPVPSLALIAAMCLSLAQSGHRDALNQCPLLGVKQTCLNVRYSPESGHHRRKRHVRVLVN